MLKTVGAWRAAFTAAVCVALFAFGAAVSLAGKKPCPGNSCHQQTTVPATTTAPTTTAAPAGGPSGPAGAWTQVFSDDFTQDAALNTSLWANESWGTACTMSFTNTNGLDFHLSSTADGHGCQIRSLTKFTYGAFEAVVSEPSNATGSQSADHAGFWTAGDSWPGDGEFDIAEAGGGYPVSTCTHAPNVNDCFTPTGNHLNAFHTYTAEWFPNPDAAHSAVVYYWDGVAVREVDNIDLAANGQYVRANFFTCISGCSESTFAPADMYIKHIRVWQHPAP